MSTKNTVCLVSEDGDLRKTLTSSFKSAGLTVIGLASAKDYVDGLAEQKPHGCLLLDAKAGAGLEVIKVLSQRRVSIPVVALVPAGFVAGAVQAIKAGAFDVAEKSTRDESAVETVKKAFAGFAKIQKLLDDKQVAVKRVASLTRREKQVLELMVQGKPNRKIADELGISPKTLDIHRSNLMDKMEARTTADLCRAHLLDRIEAVHLPHVAG